MITVLQTITADATDLLAGTQLDQIPEAGMFQIIAASTQADTLLSVTLGGDVIISNQAVPLRTAGVPDMSDDPAMVIASPGGSRPVIAVDIVTAATVMVQVQYTPASEMG